jgi:NTP pyrophosphatase (non-canonical NTP hydrolase)
MVRTIEGITAKLIHFRDARNWKQFHTPRNLVLALVGEVGEVASILQWKSDDELPGSHKNELEQELADVLSYLLLLAESLQIDLERAIIEKIEANEIRYPTDKSYGKSTKYDMLD